MMTAFEIYQEGTRIANGDGVATFQNDAGQIAQCWFEDGEYQGGTVLFGGRCMPIEDDE